VDELLSEKEQIEALRGWWRENGLYIVSGVVIGVGLLIGWNYWNSQNTQSALEASAAYESMVEEIAAGDAEAAAAIAADLYENYSSTAYAAQARLAMAKLYMDKGRDQDAANELRALVATNDESEAAMIGRLRLAKILLYQEKAQEAIDLLRGYQDTAFGSRYGETLGDAYVALGRADDAREAYTVALADNPNAPTVNRSLVQMKLNDLPEGTEDAAPGEAGSSIPASGEAAPAPDQPATVPADEPAAQGETDE
jgi:predicted negative regulator of RcsB-dependent stress response